MLMEAQTITQILQERRDLLPPLLKNDDRYWFLKHTWFKCEPPINSHWAAIVCNESGKGKSYLTMGVVQPCYPDFKPQESIAFTAEQFIKISKEKHPRHFPLILDDAGLSAFSGDALNAKVKRLSKIAQSIRHKHWQIIFNLPSFELMAKSVRITNHYYLEPIWIDYEKQITHAKFQRLKIHPFTGKLKRMNMVKKTLVKNPITGYDDQIKEKILSVAVPKVPDLIAREYENLQSEFKQRFAEESHQQALKEEEKENRPLKKSSFGVREEIEKNPEKYLVEGKFDWMKISDEYKLSDSVSMNLARKLNRKTNGTAL